VRIECGCGSVYENCPHRWVGVSQVCIKPTVKGKVNQWHELKDQVLVDRRGAPNGR